MYDYTDHQQEELWEASARKETEEIAEALDYAIEFDLNLIGLGTDLARLSERLSREVHDTEASGRFSTLARNMPIVLAHLLRAFTTDPALYVKYARDKNAYPLGRYNPSGTTRNGLTRAVDGLSALGYLENVPGFYDRSTKTGRRSRIRGTERLFEEFVQLGLNGDALALHEPAETIILKGIKRPHNPINYRDDESTNRMRGIVATYNAMLSRTDIRLAPDAPPHYGIPLNFSKKSVRRIFLNESFELGGRFYGGWWINASSEIRARILIDGSPTVELDYQSQYAHIAYSECGRDYWTEHPEDRDPYALPDIPRPLSKSAFMFMLNTRNRQSAVSTLAKEWRKAEYREFRDLGFRPSAVIDATLEKHEPIREMFFQEWSRRFQNIDSRICERNIIACVEADILALTVHDSFIVKNEHADWMEAIMREAAAEICPCSIPSITRS